MEAATHYERAAALHPAPAGKAELAGDADWCCRKVRQTCAAQPGAATQASNPGLAGRVPARPEPTHAVLPRLGQAPTGGDAAARGGLRLAVLAGAPRRPFTITL
eukprot:scaffold73406_cov28-Phaeocystis_antarctica.AAC.1